MTFPSRGPIGGWQYGDTLSHLAMSNVDADHVGAVDGEQGGVYSLTSGTRGDGSLTMTSAATKEIVLNGLSLPASADGSGLSLDGTATFATAVVTGHLQVHVLDSDSISSPGTIYAGNGVQAAGNSAFDVASMNDLVADHGSVATNLSVGGTLSTADLNISGALSIAGNESVGGILAVFGNSSLAYVGCSSLVSSGVVSGSALIGRRRLNVAEGVNADATYRLVDYDLLTVWKNAGVLTANRAYIISASGASEGMTMQVCNYNGAHTITIFGDPDYPAGQVLTPNDPVAGDPNSMRVVYSGGQIHFYDFASHT